MLPSDAAAAAAEQTAGRALHTVTCLNQRLWVVGGQSSSGMLSTVGMLCSPAVLCGLQQHHQLLKQQLELQQLQQQHLDMAAQLRVQAAQQLHRDSLHRVGVKGMKALLGMIHGGWQ